MVIGDRPLDELVPLYRDPRSDMPVTQFDMKYVEAAGLVKFDFLGLKTLSVLKEGQRLLAEQGVEVDFDTPAVGRSGGLRAAPARRHGRRVPARIRRHAADAGRRSGRPASRTSSRWSRSTARARWTIFRCSATARTAAPTIAYPHPLLEEVLKETYGIFVYQEQVMQAAQVLAGYSLGEADLLRRAMGKKIQSEMDAQRARFVEGAAANDISATKANELFDLIDKFAGYGFNKSHAAAYALIAYHTAWLKAHHRGRILRRLDELRPRPDRQARLVRRRHAPRRGRVPARPDINPSDARFTVEDGAVRYALGALKGVGEKAMEALVAERERGGPFASLENFAAPDRSELAQPPPARKPGRGRRVRCARSRPRGGVRRGRDDPRPCGQRA